MRFLVRISLPVVIFGAYSLCHAQWGSYPFPNSLDSVRVLKSSTISNPGHTEGSAYITIRRGRVHVFGNDREAQADSLEQGKASAVAIIQENCYAGTSNGFLYYQSRCTSNWIHTPIVPDSASIRAIAGVDGKIFVGTSRGVYLMTGFLASWQTLNTGLTNTSLTGLIASGTKLYALADSQVFVSLNEGASWSALATVPGATAIRAFSAPVGGKLYAGTANGIYRSTNDGATWSALNTGLASTIVHDLLDAGSTLFAATASGAYRLDTAGTGWISIDSGLVAGPVYALGLTNTFLVTARESGIWQRFLFQVTSINANTRKIDDRLRIDPTGSVSFNLATPARVNLTAYTPSGRKVAMLLNGHYPAGLHEHRVATRALSNGLYVYRLDVGEESVSRKIVHSRD